MPTHRLGLWTGLGFALASLVCTAAMAGAPQVKTQPGFYRVMVGDIEVTALNDGVIPYQMSSLFPKAPKDKVAAALAEAGLSEPVGMSYSAFLINTGSKLVLVDTGTGGKMADSPFFRGAGRVLENLRAAGYKPDQIDEVCITHLGPDHIGGLSRNQFTGESTDTVRTFPNATLRAARNEVAPFLDEKKAQAMNEAMLRFYRGLFDPYIKAGKFAPFDSDIEIVPGVRALATPGHTPGHTSYRVESKGQKLVVLGDLILLGAVQLAQPTFQSAFDADPLAAIAQRDRVFKLAADEGAWIAAAHLSFPGIGRIRVESNRYHWNPASYSLP